MTTLQELISRGRFIMADAPSRLKVYDAVDGHRSINEIARITARHENNVRRDLTMLRDAGLIQPRGNGRAPIYEKVPLARTIPRRYFEPIGRRPESVAVASEAKPATKRHGPERNHLPVPTEQEVLEIAKHGEDQVHEFKAPGTDASKIAKEIAAMLNTVAGGRILYGVEDDGTIVGTDVSRQKLDQPLQNAIKSGIAPAATISLNSVNVLGSVVLVIVVPPWNRRDVYQFQEKIYIRKGTNVFGAKPEEVRALHSGQHVV